jgi:hypothetical protein
MVFKYLTGLLMGILIGLGLQTIGPVPTPLGLGTVVLVIFSILLGMVLSSNET